MHPKLLVFAFQGTIAEKVAHKLEGHIDLKVIASSERAIDQLVEDIEHASYDSILGLGMYSGKDQDKLRIEKVCSSQFRNHKDNLERLSIPSFLLPNVVIKEAAGIGNSWCNLVSYRIMKRVRPRHFTFLHVPKNFDAIKAVRSIDQQLTKFLIENEPLTLQPLEK